MSRRDSLLAAMVAALWGFNFVVIDWGMAGIPPLLFAAIRFTLVALPACLLVPRPAVPFRTVAAVGERTRESVCLALTSTAVEFTLTSLLFRALAASTQEFRICLGILRFESSGNVVFGVAECRGAT